MSLYMRTEVCAGTQDLNQLALAVNAAIRGGQAAIVVATMQRARVFVDELRQLAPALQESCEHFTHDRELRFGDGGSVRILAVEDRPTFTPGTFDHVEVEPDVGINERKQANTMRRQLARIAA